ncbi:MAG: hemerythrin domain-containing protein, partial [Kibdelosporangium sp.]
AEVLEADRRAIERLFTELETSAGSPEHRRQLVDHVIGEVTRHSIADEQHLYPAAQDKLGGTVVPRKLAEIKESLAELEHLSPALPRFEQLVSRLISHMREHLQAERTEVSARLRAACTSEELHDLGRELAHTKEISPVSEHPTASQVPSRTVKLGGGIADQVHSALNDTP